MARSGQSPYRSGLAADYSRPGLVDAATGDRLLLQAEHSPFNAHVAMARKQGISWDQIEEVLLFCCAYAGLNKAAGAFVRMESLKAAELEH